MMTLNVKGTEYKVKFGYNSFCDTDLMDRTSDLLKLFQSEDVGNDEDVTGLGRVRDLFVCVRDLLFVGFKKFNPVDTVQEVGDILDDYHDEATEEDERGILELFTLLTEELMSEGFFGGMMKNMTETEPTTKKVEKIPQDHKKPAKK